MKNFTYYFLIGILSCISILSGYYILTKTVFKSSDSDSIRIDEYNISFTNDTEFNEFINSQIYSNLPENIQLNFSGYEYSVPVSELNFYVDSYTLIGEEERDIVEIIKENIKGENTKKIDYQVNLDPVIKNFPINIQSNDPAVIQNGVLKNCEKNEFYFEIDKNKLKKKVINAILYKQAVKDSLESILLLPEQIKIFEYCKNFKEQSVFLQDFINKINKNNDYKVEDFFEYYVSGDNFSWRVKNWDELHTALDRSRSFNDHKPYEGEYIIEDGKILIFRHPVPGKTINYEKTVININNWLQNPNSSIGFAFDSIEPSLTFDTREKVDFSKLIAVGRSRIDIIRNGRPNWVLPHAQAGLEEVNYHIVWPGEEFSFIKTINPRPDGKTENGRAIGGGICNSTTTIFRAALEAGFPITKRSNHTWNVDSYDWGYPMNIVDAAYYTSPVVDFRFVNDLGYPIIFRFEIELKNDNYQYHNLYVYTSQYAPQRQVELTNWRKWDVRSDKLFTGAFDRIVKENGVVTKQETFTSRYYELGFVN